MFSSLRPRALFRSHLASTEIACDACMALERQLRGMELELEELLDQYGSLAPRSGEAREVELKLAAAYREFGPAAALWKRHRTAHGAGLAIGPAQYQPGLIADDHAQLAWYVRPETR